MIQSVNGILGIAIAALGGAAVGVDRQRAYRENEPGAIGGLRTFTLLGTVTGVCGFLISNALITPGVVILASTAALVLIVRLGAGRILRDATTDVAAIAVLISGVTAGLGHLGIAAALYAWTLLLLIEKSWLHARSIALVLSSLKPRHNLRRWGSSFSPFSLPGISVPEGY